MVRESVAYMAGLGREVHFDAEHFFDGFAEDADYALQVLRTAHRAGALYIILCDTNGGALTPQITEAVARVRDELPDARLGIHVHNDCDLAVANSLAAVAAGVEQVQGCLNGYGERCGNANLSSIIPNLQLKMGIEVVSDEQLRELTAASRFVAELANRPLAGQSPYVGASAFAHKGGLSRRRDRQGSDHLSAHRAGDRGQRPAGARLRVVGQAQHRLQAGRAGARSAAQRRGIGRAA